MNSKHALSILSLIILPFSYANAGLLGPTAYLSAADSPFAGGSFSYFYLENFEDHLLNVPGVTASAGGVTSVIFGPAIHDSVDVDDGAIDDSELKGDSYFSGNGAAGIKFTFDAGILGSLPTKAGIVWTDGFGTTTFEAFDQNGISLCTIGPVAIADGSFNGETAEDRFFGVTNAGGISAIFISNTAGGIEVDHLQYGLAIANSVPEPSTYGMLLAGIGIFGWATRRKAQKHV